jgi:arginine deiminase
MRLNVTSEIGKLRSVLVHQPGREIDDMIPPMMAQLLFDDILYGTVAREEHRRFQQLIRFVAEDVYEIQDLLEEVFDDGELRKIIIRDFARRNRLGRRLVSTLKELKPAALAEVLIGGIPNERKQSGDLPTFDLFPVPNFFFMRDPQVVMGDGVIVSGMATQARRREALLSKYVFQYHKLFRDDVHIHADFMSNGEPESPLPRRMPTLEGGDVLVARRDLLLVGITERTSRAGVQFLARALKQTDGVRTIVAVELPKQRSFMHLDTVFTFISRNECLIYPPVILAGGDEAATVTSIDLTQRTMKYTEEKSLLHALKRHKMPVEAIFCGGRKAVDQQREQWTDGANAFALAPGIILLYERNVRTAEELAKHDYHIVYEDDLLLGRTELETWTNKKYAIQIQGNELSRARGGPRCMTMPLVRDEIA